jgi:hypothetical protein
VRLAEALPDSLDLACRRSAGFHTRFHQLPSSTIAGEKGRGLRWRVAGGLGTWPLGLTTILFQPTAAVSTADITMSVRRCVAGPTPRARISAVSSSKSCGRVAGTASRW